METRYNPKEVEPRIQKFWEENKMFKFDRNSNEPSFCIDTPPPFTSGDPHMGNFLYWTWIDIICRYKRMRGFNVLLPQGWDCHGLPTELQVEKPIRLIRISKKGS
jgi:valyl-tRNA synthetase